MGWILHNQGVIHAIGDFSSVIRLFTPSLPPARTKQLPHSVICLSSSFPRFSLAASLLPPGSPPGITADDRLRQRQNEAPEAGIVDQRSLHSNRPKEITSFQKKDTVTNNAVLTKFEYYSSKTKTI